MTIEANTIAFPLTLPESLKKAISVLKTEGATCRIVGGSIRDALLGLEPKDFDVEVYGIDLDTVANSLQCIGKTDLVGRSFSVVKLWINGAEYDFAIPRRESKTGHGHREFEIVADPSMTEFEAIQRRDFTINALLYDPEKELVIDYCHGLEDIESKTLKHVSAAFSEDPLRVLRAVQFAGRFGFSLDDETASLCRSIKQEYWSLSIERIWEEWKKWSNRSQYPFHGLEALRKSGWLSFYGELNALVDLPQDSEWHPEGSVWIHTGKCLEALFNQTDWKTLDSETRTTLMFATLCHDLGKARCTRFAMKGDRLRWISPAHDQASGWLARQFLERIGAPSTIIQKVVNLVKNHHFLNTGSINIPSDSSIRRLARRMEPSSIRELSYVMISDHLGRPPNISEEQAVRIDALKTRVETLSIKDTAVPPLLLGRDLVDLGLKPGLQFKAYLSAAYEAQLDGTFHSKEGAIAWFQMNRKSI